MKKRCAAIRGGLFAEEKGRENEKNEEVTCAALGLGFFFFILRGGTGPQGFKKIQPAPPCTGIPYLNPYPQKNTKNRLLRGGAGSQVFAQS